MLKQMALLRTTVPGAPNNGNMYVSITPFTTSAVAFLIALTIGHSVGYSTHTSKKQFLDDDSENGAGK